MPVQFVGHAIDQGIAASKRVKFKLPLTVVARYRKATIE